MQKAWHGVVSSVTVALLGVGTEGFQELSAWQLNFRISEKSYVKAVKRKEVEQDQVLSSGICLDMSTYTNIHMGQVITHIHDKQTQIVKNKLCMHQKSKAICLSVAFCMTPYISLKSPQSLLLSVKQNMMICYCSILLKWNLYVILMPKIKNASDN